MTYLFSIRLLGGLENSKVKLNGSDHSRKKHGNSTQVAKEKDPLKAKQHNILDKNCDLEIIDLDGFENGSLRELT